MNENQTFAEFLEEYKGQERQVHKLDYANLSEDDRQLLSDFAEKKAFLKEMQNSLDFVQESTAVIQREQDGKQLLSLESMLYTHGEDGKPITPDKNVSKEAYIEYIAVLTNKLDKNAIDEIQKGQNPYDTVILNKQMKMVLDTPEMKQELERQLQEREQITINEIREVQERIEEEKKYLQIQEQESQNERNNEASKSAERFDELAATAALTVIAVSKMDELTKVVEELSQQEKDIPEISVSAEIAEDGTAIIKNIEGTQKQPDAEIDTSAVQEQVEQKVNEVKQDIQETVELHSREVAPKSEQAEVERTTEKAEKKETAKSHRKHSDIDR